MTDIHTYFEQWILPTAPCRLLHMTTREEVADLIYQNQYPDPTNPGIQPLAERPLWEREMIYRGADKLMPLLAEAWEKGAKAQEVYESCYRLAVPYGDPMPPTPTNPYTAEAQVNGL